MPGASEALKKIDRSKKSYGEVSEKGKEMEMCVICTE